MCEPVASPISRSLFIEHLFHFYKRRVDLSLIQIYSELFDWKPSTNSNCYIWNLPTSVLTLEKFKPHIWLQLQQKMSSGLRTKIILRLSPAVRSLVSSEDEYWNNYELDRRLIGLLRWFISSGGEVTWKNKLEILWECTAVAVQCSHCEIFIEINPTWWVQIRGWYACILTHSIIDGAHLNLLHLVMSI